MEQNLTVVKIGSNTIVDENGVVRKNVINDILSSIKKIIHDGDKVILVTSGAVKLGRKILQNTDNEATIVASIGQTQLFDAYYHEAKKMNITLVQFLLTRPYVVEREHFLSLQETIKSLFDKGSIPIINENDALVANTEWSFGDNDTLAVALAISFGAKKLVIVSHIEGLFETDPTKDKNARIISAVRDVNVELLKYVSKNTSAGGRGGMVSKLKAARIATAVGIEVRIINGLQHGNLTKALKGQSIGTVFLPRAVKSSISNRERWLLAAKNSAGSIEVDRGAIEALKSGKSLLAVGVSKTNGQFDAGEIIEIVDADKQGIAFGIVDCSNKEIESMLKLKQLHGKQLMHANNIIKII